MDKPGAPGLCHILQLDSAFSIHTTETSKASHPCLMSNCPHVNSRNLKSHFRFKESSPLPAPVICLNTVIYSIQLILLLLTSIPSSPLPLLLPWSKPLLPLPGIY